MRDTAKQVLAEVAEHHELQHERYGFDNKPMPDGTGPDAEWLKPVLRAAWLHFERSHYPFEADAGDVEDLFREEWDYDKDGTDEERAAAAADCSWLRLLREEVAEAFAAPADSKALEAELIQVAAVAVSWVAVIRERGSS
jgi:hypothetical protein